MNNVEKSSVVDMLEMPIPSSKNHQKKVINILIYMGNTVHM